MAGKKSDLDLLGLVVAGDQQAFSQLVLRYQSKVLNLIYRYVGERSAAEDLAQEVFFKVWKHVRKFKGQSAFSTWLHRLTINACLNYRKQRKTQTESLPLAGDFEANTPNASDGLMAIERESMLKKALASLPTRQRMAVVLANFEGNSYAEIATIMGVSISSVESLLFRARQNLADILRPIKKRGEL